MKQDIEALIARVRDGDRDAAAALVLRYGPIIRRRLRNKLSPDLRRVYDEEDLLASVARRFDASVKGGRVAVEGEQQLIAFLLGIGRRTVAERARKFGVGPRARSAMAESSRQWRERADVDAPGCTEAQELCRAVRGEGHRELLCWVLAGRSLAEFARVHGISPATVRMRWQRLRAMVRRRSADGGGPGGERERERD